VDLGEFRQVIGLRRDRRARRKMIFPKPMLGEFSLYILYVEIQYCLKCIFHIIVYIYIIIYIYISNLGWIKDKLHKCQVFWPSLTTPSSTTGPPATRPVAFP
jgi:hypothetical protein